MQVQRVALWVVGIKELERVKLRNSAKSGSALSSRLRRSKRVNGAHIRQREQKLDDAKAERSRQRRPLC